MTLSKVIQLADDAKPNAFSEELKTAWINDCEGLVQTEVWLTAIEEVITYNYETDKDRELLVRAPHDKIYRAYLTAMIDLENGEYSKYTNTMQVFNAWFEEYMCWYANHYRPADRRAEPWKGYYFTAYGIAVKHGFRGTEEEWLESLDGEPGELRVNEETNMFQWKRAKTEEQWIDLFDLNDLQGPAGSQGPQGLQGEKGKDGISIVGISLERTNVGDDIITASIKRV